MIELILKHRSCELVLVLEGSISRRQTRRLAKLPKHVLIKIDKFEFSD